MMLTTELCVHSTTPCPRARAVYHLSGWGVWSVGHFSSCCTYVSDFDHRPRNISTVPTHSPHLLHALLCMSALARDNLRVLTCTSPPTTRAGYVIVIHVRGHYARCERDVSMPARARLRSRPSLLSSLYIRQLTFPKT